MWVQNHYKNRLSCACKNKNRKNKKEKEKMSTIEVGKIGTSRKISDAVEVGHLFYNTGEKEIKYIRFSYLPYNAVNDMVACTVSGKNEATGKLTGPIPPKYKGLVNWERMWYNPTITSAVLTHIHIQYMDNTEEVIDGKDIVCMDDPNSMYYNEITIPNRKKAEKERKISNAVSYVF